MKENKFRFLKKFKEMWAVFTYILKQVSIKMNFAKTKSDTYLDTIYSKSICLPFSVHVPCAGFYAWT